MLPYTACYQEYCVHVRACLWFQSSDIIAALIGFTYFSTRKTQGLRAPVGFRLLQGRLNECSISTVQGLPNRSKHPLGFCLIGICSCNNITAVLLISPAAPWIASLYILINNSSSSCGYNPLDFDDLLKLIYLWDQCSKKVSWMGTLNGWCFDLFFSIYGFAIDEL
jgi:hypothetical protein